MEQPASGAHPRAALFHVSLNRSFIVVRSSLLIYYIYHTYISYIALVLEYRSAMSIVNDSRERTSRDESGTLL
jgi:hypothetical protein